MLLGSGVFAGCGPGLFGVGPGVPGVSPLPPPIVQALNGTVNVIVSDGSTGFYVGGAFTTVGSVTRNRLARFAYDGTLDTAFNPDINNSVSALALGHGVLYVGGAFTAVNGGTTRNRIAALDPATGVATSWNPNADNTLSALTTLGSYVYAGGVFTNIGGLARSNIAQLDNSAGNATGTWNASATATSVLSLVNDGASTVYVGGNYSIMGSAGRTHLAALPSGATATATSWNPSPTGQIDVMAVSGFWAEDSP